MRRRFLVAALIALSVVLFPLSLAPKVQAPTWSCGTHATICWKSASTGYWYDPANWILPGGAAAGRIPTDSDDVDFPSGTYTVTMDFGAETVNSIHVSSGVTLDCTSTCTLIIKSHTPIWWFDIDAGLLTVHGNVANHAALVDSSFEIDIFAGGTFVNFNSLDLTTGIVQNNGVFVNKCNSHVTRPAGIVGSGTVLTESPCPTQVSTASGSAISGTVSFSTDLGGFTSLTSTAVSSVSPSPPSGFVFPAGLFSFTISGLRVGETVEVTIILPAPLPAGEFAYWKFNGGTWTDISPATCTLACSFLSSDRETVTLWLTDGVSPDDADGLANGVIVDPGGSAIPATTTATTTAHLPAPVGGAMLPSAGFIVLLPWVIVLSVLGVLSVEAFIFKRRAKRR